MIRTRMPTRISSLFIIVLLLTTATAQGQSNDECLACHSEPSLSMERKGKAHALFVDGRKFAGSVHADLECVSCHEGFAPDQIPHAKKRQPVACTSCHADEQFLAVGESVHGTGGVEGETGACVSCHSSHAVARVTTLDSLARARSAEQLCASCHADVAELYAKSEHGIAVHNGVAGAPGCMSCHGVHDVRHVSDESSPVSRKHEAELCLACHVDNPEVRARVGPSAGFISSYENSVHAKAFRDGNEGAATCSDCHGSHEVRKGSDRTSRVAKENIASTCGQCHGDILEQYQGSIHGTVLAKGVIAAPTCTDCHGEHNILSPKDPSSPVAKTNLSSQVCSPCHASVKLTSKFGLASDRFQSYEDSFHGLASKAGSVEVANCASCHGIHDIKPSSDSTSRISPKNLAKTCGTCHPGANENFTRGQVHVIATSGGDELLYVVSTAYIILIVVVIGGMALHNILDFVKKGKRQLMIRRGILPAQHTTHRLYLRMNLSERLQHAALFLSFGTLVFTGFMLKYPDAWWVVPIRTVSPLVFEIRGLVHRIAGVAMVIASLYHIYYLFFVPRGKQLLLDLLPVRKDITDAIGVMKYNLGLSPEKPQFGRFSYIEKSEYWALVWGTIVMAATGAILWFDNTFLGLITKLWWDVARTVHYYEAWLATLAIVIWHFYFVIFNPDSYPMNVAWFKGTLTEAEMEEEHALELDAIHEREKQEAADMQNGNDGKSSEQKPVPGTH